MPRDGERPVHILPWAAQDYRDSKVRARSMRTGDPMLRLVYLELLFAMQCQGGSVSADIDNLEDELALDPAEIERCLPVLKKLGGDGRGGIVEVDGMLSNRRVMDEIQRAKSSQAQRSEAGRASRDARRAALGSAQPPLPKAHSAERTFDDSRTPVRDTPNDRPNEPRTAAESRSTVGGSPIPSLPLPTQEQELLFPGAPAEPVSVELVKCFHEDCMKPLDKERHWAHFPVTGTEGKLWPLGDRLLKEFRAAFPAMDMLPTIRQAYAWVVANQSNRKTAGGMPRFLNHWLGKAQNGRTFVPLPGAEARPQRRSEREAPLAGPAPAIRAIAQGAGGGDDFDLTGGPT